MQMEFVEYLDPSSVTFMKLTSRFCHYLHVNGVCRVLVQLINYIFPRNFWNCTILLINILIYIFNWVCILFYIYLNSKLESGHINYIYIYIYVYFKWYCIYPKMLVLYSILRCLKTKFYLSLHTFGVMVTS